jgi:heme/copper-type cytochrome/quinol oxidase subunit 2
MILNPKLLRLCFLPLFTLALVLALASIASACPTCKDSLASSDPGRENIVRGYFYSILFMLAMPFTIFTAMSAYFYYEVRKARKQKLVAAANGTTPSREIASSFATGTPAASR